MAFEIKSLNLTKSVGIEVSRLFTDEEEKELEPVEGYFG
jgi:hypothetical protein